MYDSSEPVRTRSHSRGSSVSRSSRCSWSLQESSDSDDPKRRKRRHSSGKEPDALVYGLRTVVYGFRRKIAETQQWSRPCVAIHHRAQLFSSPLPTCILDSALYLCTKKCITTLLSTLQLHGLKNKWTDEKVTEEESILTMRKTLMAAIVTEKLNIGLEKGTIKRIIDHVVYIHLTFCDGFPDHAGRQSIYELLNIVLQIVAQSSDLRYEKFIESHFFAQNIGGSTFHESYSSCVGYVHHPASEKPNSDSQFVDMTHRDQISYLEKQMQLECYEFVDKKVPDVNLMFHSCSTDTQTRMTFEIKYGSRMLEEFRNTAWLQGLSGLKKSNMSCAVLIAASSAIIQIMKVDDMGGFINTTEKHYEFLIPTSKRDGIFDVNKFIDFFNDCIHITDDICRDHYSKVNPLA